jgi:uncharacterized protein, YfiH family
MFMSIYTDKDISIYFGDSSDQLFMSEDTYEVLQNTHDLIAVKPFSRLSSTMPIEAILFPRQVHGTTGFLVDKQALATTKPFSIQSDYLITNMSRLGIGILTADCLPVLLHDTKNQALAAIHAGWRGSVAGIVIKALAHMTEAFGTSPSDIRVFFGPSACQCCYSVGTDLAEAVKPYKEQVLKTRNNELFFDLAHYNRILLQNANVPASAFCNEYAKCTICNHQLWSYRRQQKDAGRQMTVISLK